MRYDQAGGPRAARSQSSLRFPATYRLPLPMTWIFDQPLYIVILGIVLGVLVGAVWTMTGRKEALFALAGVVVATLVMLVVERLVVTDAEEIHRTLAEIARKVKANDMDGLLSHIAKSNPGLIDQARNEMPNYKFTDCRVSKVHELDVDTSAEPRSARVEFNVTVDGTFSYQGSELSGRFARWVQLQLVREADGQWRVENYRHADPTSFMMQMPTESYESNY
jgi:hypothetical protein